MIAEAITGNGDGALDYYLRINPSAREEISDLHRCEPYVYAQMIAGRDAATPGEAKNSWLTGTAAWNMVAISQWILGIRPEHDGLRIEPVIPRSWTSFRASRRFRGTTYDIAVRQDRRDAPGRGSRRPRRRPPPRGVDPRRRPADRGHADPARGSRARRRRCRGPARRDRVGRHRRPDGARGLPRAPDAAHRQRRDRHRDAGRGRPADRRPAAPRLPRQSPRRDAGPRLGDGARALRAPRRTPAVAGARGPGAGGHPGLRRARGRPPRRWRPADRGRGVPDRVRPLDGGPARPGPADRCPSCTGSTTSGRTRSSWPRGRSRSCPSAARRCSRCAGRSPDTRRGRTGPSCCGRTRRWTTPASTSGTGS